MRTCSSFSFEKYNRGKSGYIAHSARTELLDRAVLEAARRHGMDEVEILVYLESYVSACDTDRLIYILSHGRIISGWDKIRDMAEINDVSYAAIVEHYRLAIGRAKWSWWHRRACDEYYARQLKMKLSAS